jgi:predicted dehydrogenase
MGLNARLEGERLQVAEGGGDVLERLLRLVLLDDVPLDAGGTSRLENRGERQIALARRGVARLRAWRAVLHVEEADAVGGGPDLGDGITTAHRRPEDVQLDVECGRQLGEEDVPDGCAIERLELERVVVVAEPDARGREPVLVLSQLEGEAADVGGSPPVGLGDPRHDQPPATYRHQPIGHVVRVFAECFDPHVRGDRPQPVLAEQPSQLIGVDIWQPGDLDCPVAGRGDGAQCSRQVDCREPPNGVELERDLVVSHGATIGHRCRSLSGMTPLGIGIVGTGNIAGGYARDIPTHPEIRLVAATDLDPVRAAAFGEAHGCRIHGSVTDLVTDDEVDIVVNLTVHQAHYEVTKRALEAGRHVYSEKPLALSSSEAHELVELASSRGLRLGSSPSTFLGEAQQTAAAMIASGRLGTVRAVYSEVNWGRIETWHPAPAPFYEVGALFDVGVYPLTLVTTMVGPARSVRAWGWDLKPERLTKDGTPFRIASPDLVVAAIELDGGAVLRLTASFYVGRPAKQLGSLEFHGDDGSLFLGNFQEFDAAVEFGAFGKEYEAVALVRTPFHGTAWARGVAEMAAAIAEGRPHRASGEQAAHIVDILEAAAASMRADGQPIEVTSTFAQPPLMPWAQVGSAPATT